MPTSNYDQAAVLAGRAQNSTNMALMLTGAPEPGQEHEHMALVANLANTQALLALNRAVLAVADAITGRLTAQIAAQTRRTGEHRRHDLTDEQWALYVRDAELPPEQGGVDPVDLHSTHLDWCNASGCGWVR